MNQLNSLLILYCTGSSLLGWTVRLSDNFDCSKRSSQRMTDETRMNDCDCCKPCWRELRVNTRICKRIFLLRLLMKIISTFISSKKNISAYLLTFLHDSFLVIISQASRQFIVIHCWSIFLETPSPSNFFGFYQFELHSSSCPSDARTESKSSDSSEILEFLSWNSPWAWLVKQSDKKLPKLQRTSSLLEIRVAMTRIIALYTRICSLNRQLLIVRCRRNIIWRVSWIIKIPNITCCLLMNGSWWSRVRLRMVERCCRWRCVVKLIG